MRNPSLERIQLSVVFVQYDRRKYRRALERLIGSLSRFESVDFRIVTIDNANPGPWYHEVSSDLIQLGGDNSAWEFSAFDRGVEFLSRHGLGTKVYAFATDAFQAYGTSYLDLIDDRTLHDSLTLKAAIGWIDSFGQDLALLDYRYREWMRTSLFFMPAELLKRCFPLQTAFDPRQIFGAGPAQPFLPSAPISDNLRALLLAWLTTVPTDITLGEVWHSQFDLDDSNFDFFRHKVSAILREQLLSARMQAQGIPCYDIRWLQRLHEGHIDAATLSTLDKQSSQWGGWRSARLTGASRCQIDRFEAPRALRHGEPSTLSVSGWIDTEPRTHEILLEFSDGSQIGAPCCIVRDDVAKTYPELADRPCGFDLETSLEHLPPGLHEVTWRVPDTKMHGSLGKVRVLPICRFEPKRSFVPETAHPDEPISLSLEGTLTSSHAVEEVEFHWDSKPTDLNAVLVEDRSNPGARHRYRVIMNGEVARPVQASHHRGELRALTQDGWQNAWRESFHIAVGDHRPHTLEARELGGFDPHLETASFHISGTVLAHSSDDRVVLAVDGARIAEQPLEAATTALDSRVRRFELRGRTRGVAPGPCELTLALELPSSTPEVFARWQDHLRLEEPRIFIDSCEVEPPLGKSSPYVLNISGWVENHFMVSHLDLEIDGENVERLAFELNRPDVAKHQDEALVRRQGFLAAIDLMLPAGPHEVRVLANQKGGPKGSWETTLDFPENLPLGFLVTSDELDSLAESTEHRFWHSIAIHGEVTTDRDEVMATLFVDDLLADQQLITDQPFELRFIPEASGNFKVRVLFNSRGQTLYDSGVVSVSFSSVPIPATLSTALDRFLDAFAIRQKLGLGMEAEYLVRSLLEQENDSLSDLEAMTRDISSALDRAATSNANIVTPRSYEQEPEPRRLKVLFASWEVPCTRHGGGVWMINLLRHLTRDHDLTLIHSYGLGEEPWIDEVRPYVSRVISIPRHRGIYRGSTRLPSYIRDNYNPALRTAIEAELLSHDYDIVDYEYSWMFPYVSQADVPRVVTIFEEGFVARLSSHAQTVGSDAEKIQQLDDLIEEFYFRRVSLPESAEHFITPTQEDAEAFSPFLDDGKIYVNTIGVDTRDFQRPQGELETPDHPRLVFLGNYRHPPNVAAALYLAEKIMPGVWTRYPSAELQIIGPHPTEAIEALTELEQISVLGFVEDIKPYFWQATAFVAPIFTGAGMRVKILEAMACGVAVVGTELSMHGLGASEGAHYLRAETATQFIEHLCRIIESPSPARAIGKAGCKLIEDLHSCERKAMERAEIWREVIADWQRKQHQSLPRHPLTVVRGNSAAE
ncbi:MAG: glycosyltransferase family 4 protein [Acidobacteriota bacterium]